MPATLRLTLTDYVDPTRWRWVLSDAQGGFLADHAVHLDPSTREYQGLLDLAAYLDFFREAYPPERQLKDLGRWVGEQVFGGLRDTLWAKRGSPAVPVQVIVPAAAQQLLFLPFELARFADGSSFRQAGIRFIYRREALDAPWQKQSPNPSLRILAVFSLPVRQNPLNLRRERYGLQRFVRELNLTQGKAVELRILQYGATRALLEDTLQDGDGWDLVHLSGHGERGELLLEDDRGGTDAIDAEDLGDLLAPTAERLKLLILDTCYSGAGSHAAARVQVGLDQTPLRETGAEGEALAETARTVLPSLAQRLAERLDCAALAMRYPVGDAFATELMLALYDKLLDRRRPLPAALHLALDAALESPVPHPPLSWATPILLGKWAAELQLIPPQRPLGPLAAASVDLTTYFPEEPARFVGRLQPMLRASQALASRSPERGVLFHGMPGAGKTACALELSYRHAEQRFIGHVWYEAPQAGSDIATALFKLLFEIQRQLNAPDLGLTTELADPQRFRAFGLPKLRGLLQQHSLLLVLDNLENLLSDSGQWRDPLWGDVVATLLGHTGLSRVVLTSRRVPADLQNHPQLQREAIHALSFAESVLLARELPQLNTLFGDAAGIKLLQQTLSAIQGHPKLLELADGLAVDRQRLATQVQAATAEATRQGENLADFFAPRIPQEGETRRSDAGFVHQLHGWTAGVAATLSATAQLLFQVLAGLEPEDRRGAVLEANWQDILTRLGDGHPSAPAALAEAERGLPAALETLARVGLIGLEPPADLTAEQQANVTAYLAQQTPPITLTTWWDGYRRANTAYPIHPGVAEAARAAAAPAVMTATDIELGNYHIQMHRHGLKTEQEGGGATVVSAARRAAPYLLRQARWAEASNLLEQLLHRDQSPEAVATVLPLLERIAAATQGTEREVIDAGLLAKTLALAGQVEAAEARLRDLIPRRVAGGDYRLASALAGELVKLLRDSGRLDAAMTLAEEMAGYTRQAGLGPWTQLGDEGRRLQILALLGRYDEVLAAVEALRPQLAALPEQSEAEESVDPWNVREGLLDCGHTAALHSKRYARALELNAEIAQMTEQRGAPELQLANTRFNDYGPLLRLGRYPDARALLLACRGVFETAHALEMLGKVWSALADLEDQTGDRRDAVRFAEIALGYNYQSGQPEDCAISHHNLASYLERLGAPADSVLAQRLAAALIRYQTQSGRLQRTLAALAKTELPPQPPRFDAVAETVEQTEGVRFRALYERLPRTAPDGEAAIAAVWQLAMAARRQALAEQAERERKQAVLAAMPESIRAAFDLDGEAFAQALRAALVAMPEDEAAARFQELRDADLIGGGSDQAGNSMPEAFEPLLQAIAAVAGGDDDPRAEIEAALAHLETQGWKLTDPVQHIWSGERDAAALTAGLDDQDSAVVRRVLELIGA